MKIWQKCIACGRYVVASELIAGMCDECDRELQEVVGRGEE
ncbi:MAG: hypothetical protein DDT19_01728 [Syntrophomonadaceae bacterium]|nr:hypothetical protein [Bacillota bacterium]